MRLRIFLAGCVLLIAFLWWLTGRKPREETAATDSGNALLSNELLLRDHPDLMPEQVAVLILEPGQEALPIARTLQPVGVPFMVTRDFQSAFRHRLVFVPFGDKAVRLDENLRAAFTNFVSNGGLLVLQVPPENPWAWLTGVRSASPSRQRKKLSFGVLSDPMFSYLTEPEEQAILLGAPEPAEGIWTEGLRPMAESGAVAIADFSSTGEAAVVRRRLGAGAVYTLGFSLKDVVLRPQAQRSFDAARIPFNGFEPAADVFPLILRALYERSSPFWARLRSTPQAGPLRLMTHSVGPGANLGQAREFALLESSRSVAATWFLQTRIGTENTQAPFYDTKMRAFAAELSRLGHEVASRGASHGSDFARLPLGGGETTKTYHADVDDEGRSLDATLKGESGVSKALLESVLSSRTISGFRAPSFAYPTALDAVLEQAGYLYDSSVAADGSLTHFPYRLTKGRALAQESPVIEFPASFSDSAPKGRTLAAHEMLAAAARLTSYGGIAVWDILPDGEAGQGARLQTLLEGAPPGTRWLTMREAALFWSRLTQARLSFADGKRKGEKELRIASSAGVGGLSLALSGPVKSCASDVAVTCSGASVFIDPAVSATEARITVTMDLL